MIVTPQNGGCTDVLGSHDSPKSKFFALKLAELGTSVSDVCRKLGISDATFYTWCKKCGGISPSALKPMLQLEEENLRQKKVVADLSLYKTMLQDILAKKSTSA